MQSSQGPGPTECKPFVEALDTSPMMRIGPNVLEMVTYSGALSGPTTHRTHSI
jgi:hypothetical protein